MKRLLLASAAIVATAFSAHAADLPRKAPIYKAPALPVAYDWTGWYMGVNAGYGLGRNRYIDWQPASASANSFFLSSAGGFGGGQIGYNWQSDSLFGPLLIGVEADIQGGSLSGGALLNSFNVASTYQQRLDWFGTVRGRIGLSKGPVFGYFTGGYAYGNVKTDISQGGAGILSTSNTRSGWTYGSGVEAVLGGNWTGKLEYLYLNLGDTQTQLVNGNVVAADLRQHIFRVGLNYNLNGRNANYVEPVSIWNGWYVGANFGSGTGRNNTTLAGAGFADSYTLQPDGFIGGGQIGYNFQANNWVWGLEADFQGSTQKDNKTCVLGCVTGSVGQYNSKLPWLGTVRGRLGHAVGPSLFYVTGGYAYGSVKDEFAFTALGVTDVISHTSTRSGWTVGAGIETPFTFFGLFGPNWTTKTEYLYVDLGKSTVTGTLFGTPVSHETNFNQHIFRTGINYNFNAPTIVR